MSRARKVATSIGLGCLVLLGVFHAAQYRFRLAHLPEGLGVWRIVHVNERVFGFGPGGNETGVLIYALPRRSADAIAAQGLAWLDALPDAPGGWQATPATPDSADWADPARCDFPGTPSAQTCPGLGLHLNRYGFGIPLEEGVEQMVNDALFAPGAYWVAQPTGFVLVIPSARRVVFAYAG